MADNVIKKIDQLTVIDPSTNESTSYDIDLPADATPSIASLTVTGNDGVTAKKFVKDGGTSSQFLKADGSVDSTDYNNQNAFSSIVAGSTTISAGNATDTVTINGSNVNVTGNASSNVITVGIDSTGIANALGYTPADDSAVVHKTGNLSETVTGQKTFTSTIYSDVNDLNFIGKQGKIGFRAYKPNTTDNAGQMLITSDGTVSGSYRLSVQAYNKTKSTATGSDVYTTLRVGDTEGLLYKIGSTSLFHVDDVGNIDAPGYLTLGNTSTESSQVGNNTKYDTGSIVRKVKPTGTTTVTTYTYTYPNQSGTLALTGDLPEVNDGTLTINKNGTEAGTFSANQDYDTDIDIDIVEKVASTAAIPDNEAGLYRYTEETDIGEQSSHIIEVIKKDYDASEVLFEKTTETNNTSLTNVTFFNHFANTLPGWLTISSASGIYALYYNLPFNGIRFGAGSSAGTFTFTLSADCDITFYKYFSYNGSTHEIISYDVAAKVIVDGVDHTFVDDTTPVVVSLSAGTHTISSYYYVDPETSAKTTGRIILTSFEFEGDPYTDYEQKELARVEDVQVVDTKLEQHKTESHNRFVTDEQAIERNRQGVAEINGKLGDIQLFQSQYTNLPTASAEYKDKIYRDKNSNALFQCISGGNGVAKDWNFADVSGTSEITSSNVNSFYGNAGGNFDDFFEVNYDSTTTKFYRNNGSLKLGSSSAIGVLSLDVVSSLGLTSLKIGVKAYNANGSTVYFEVDDGSETHFISNTDTETLFDLTSIAVGTSYVYIASQASHEEGEEGSEVTVNNDKRLIITRIIADFGTITYSWVPAGVPEIAFTNDLKIKNLPIGGSYLYWPDEGNGYLVRKYYDGSYTELYFIEPTGYSYYSGDNIENTTVMNAYDNADWYDYINSVKTLNTNNSTAQTATSESISGNGTINLHKVSKTGNYNDLLNKPDIPDDSNLVHKTGAETITGTKTFTSTPIIQANDGSSGNKMMAISYNQIQSYGTTTGGNTKLVFPNPASSSTTYTLNLPTKTGTLAIDSDIVHKGTSSSSVNETIYGQKTFEDLVTVNNSLNVTNYDSVPLAIAGDGDNGPIISINTDSHDQDNIYYISVADASAGSIGLILPAKSGTLATTDDITITSATDDILDATITSKSLKYAPYASSNKAAGRLYSGTTNPTNNTRLNYDGYFYATKLYSGGNETLTLAGGTLQNNKSIILPNSSSTSSHLINTSISSTSVQVGDMDLAADSATVALLQKDRLNFSVTTNSSSIANTSYKAGSIINSSATLTLPTTTGTLAIDSEVVHKTGDETISGSKAFTGTVGNTQTAAGVYLGLDTNTNPGPNANIAIVSSNNAAYIDMGSPNEDHAFRIIKWNEQNNTSAQFVYNNNGSINTLTLPRATGTIALTSDPHITTASVSGNTLTLTKQDNTTVTYTPSFTDTNYYAKTLYNSGNDRTKIATGYSGSSTNTTYDLYVPNATSLQAGIVTTGTQTFAGNKTFSSYTNFIDYNDAPISISHNADNSSFINIYDDNSGYSGYLALSDLSNDRDYYFPDKSGTIALLDDTKIEILDFTTIA